MAKTEKQIGSFVVSKESVVDGIGFLKIMHSSKDFSIRAKGTNQEIEKFFSDSIEPDSKKYYEVIFASVKLFFLIMFGNPEYAQAWMEWHNAYFEAKNSEVTEVEDKEIVEEEKELYNLEQTQEENEQHQ